MRKYLAGFLTATLLFAVSATAFAAVGNSQITVSYNNIKVYVDQTLADLKDVNGNKVEPFIYNGTTYLPVRAVSEALGKEVSWDNAAKAVYVGTQPSASEAAITVPDEIQAVKDKVIKIASDGAVSLSGDWGDQHAAMMAAGEARAYKDFASMKAALDKIRIDSGARYVYALIPETADNPKNFLITVDGSAEPDEWKAPYETEIQFIEAMAGTPAAARSAWGDGEEGADPCWSAFAPIQDSKGNIVAILGVDFPAPEIEKFPEWNRDKAEWNGVKE